MKPYGKKEEQQVANDDEEQTAAAAATQHSKIKWMHVLIYTITIIT
jgi:hypothetical protein